MGGFSGQWGQEKPKVKRKRRLLVDEGVSMESTKSGAYKVSLRSILTIEDLRARADGKTGPESPRLDPKSQTQARKKRRKGKTRSVADMFPRCEKKQNA